MSDTTRDPADDVFESDPFFNSDTPQHESQPEEAIPFDIDEIPLDEVPTITLAPTPPESAEPKPAPETTAEERLLNTIVGEPVGSEPTSEHESPLLTELASLRSELHSVLEERQKALADRDRVRRDLQTLKARFSTLESELNSARSDAGKANQLKLQAETRFAEAERQWSDKLAHVRQMLEEVEHLRDELSSKRVPKILFKGALTAGLAASVIAYFIGAGTGPSSDALVAPPLPSASVASPTEPRARPLPPANPDYPETPARTSPALSSPEKQHEHLSLQGDPGSSSIQSGLATNREPRATYWPTIKGSGWSTTIAGQAMTVVFHYGIFMEGTELSSAARQDLKLIAAALKGTSFKVEVEGHTDSTPATKSKTPGSNNKALGLSRATVAATYLIQQGGLKADQVSTSSAGEARPPHPNTTQDNRKKNRTVVLKIRP